MTDNIIICPDCKKNKISKYGKTPAGLQKYRCLVAECGRQFVPGSDHHIEPGIKTIVMKMIKEGIPPKKIFSTVNDEEKIKISLRWIHALKKDS